MVFVEEETPLKAFSLKYLDLGEKLDHFLQTALSFLPVLVFCLFVLWVCLFFLIHGAVGKDVLM